MRPERYDVTPVNAQCQDNYFTYVPAYTKTKDYVLMLTTHNDRALHINDVGKVTAANIAFAQPITMDIVGDPFNGDPFFITLYAKQVGLFLCFRRGRLVGLKQLTRDCHFSETIEHGHYMYANAYNATLRVGFTKRFKPIGPKRLQHAHSIRKDHFLFERRKLEDIITSRSTTTTTKRTTTISTTTTTATKTTTTTPTAKPTHMQQNKHHSHKHNSNNDNSSVLRPSIEEEKQQQQLLHTDAAKSITNDKHNDSHHSHNENNKSNNSINDNNNNKNNHNRKDQQRVDVLDEHEAVHKVQHTAPEHPLRHDGNSIRNKNRRRRLQQRRKHQQQKHQHNLQAKNLVRHHHNNSTKMARRRQHEREQLLRKQSRQRQQLLARHERQQREQTVPPTPTPGPGAATSSSASTAASALTATAASLVPTTLIDIMAMLAATRRKRGRRKKDVATDGENASTRTGAGSVAAHASDMQIAEARTILPSTRAEEAAAKKQKAQRLLLEDVVRDEAKASAQSQAALDAATAVGNSASSSTQRQRQHNNKRALEMQAASVPVSALQHVAEKVARAQTQSKLKKQQINEYSNSYVNSNLNSNYNNKLNTYTNAYANNDNINNNDYVNAIPALPKNYFNDNTHQRANYDVHSDVGDAENVNINNNAREHRKAAAINVSHSAKAHSKRASGSRSAHSTQRKSSSRPSSSDSINPSMTDYVSSNRNFKFSQQQQQQQQQQQALSHSRLRYRRRAAVTEATNEATATTASHDENEDDDVAKHIDVDRHVAEQHLPHQHAQQQFDLAESAEVTAKLISSAASFERANTNKNTNIPIKETKTNIINANMINDNADNKFSLNIESKLNYKENDDGIDINVNNADKRKRVEGVAAVHVAAAQDNNVKRTFFDIRLPFFRQPSINNNNINNNNNHVVHIINNNINMDVVAHANANQMNVNAIANADQVINNNNANNADNPINVANDDVNNAAAVALAAGNLANAAPGIARANVIDANFHLNNNQHINHNDENVHAAAAANNENIYNVYEHLFTAYHKRFFRSLNYANTNHNVNNSNNDDDDDDDHGVDKDDDELKRNHNKYDMTIVQYRYVVVFY